MNAKDYTAAAEWAEHDMKLPEASRSALRGDDAAEFGRRLLSRAGRPSLDPHAGPGEHSPRRQVRLPQELSDAVDQIAAEQGRTAASVMRDAISEYLARHPSA